MSDGYEDIISMHYRKSDRYPHMSIRDRAAQFAPFSALTGYSDTVNEAGRLTDGRRTLDDYEKELINRELQYALYIIDISPMAAVVYFVPDEKKSGGAYRAVKERIDRIDDYERTVILVTGEVIPIDEISFLIIEK